jgi:predicted RNA binding protein YcfA (HicA-like mRNA interferase family)
VVSEEPTRTVVKRLKKAAFTQSNAKGSHTKWTHPTGVQVILPTGHRTISPGVVRQVNKAIKECEERK